MKVSELLMKDDVTISNIDRKLYLHLGFYVVTRKEYYKQPKVIYNGKDLKFAIELLLQE